MIAIVRVEEGGWAHPVCPSCTTETARYVVDDGTQWIVRTRTCTAGLADFHFVLQARLPDGTWSDVVRVSMAHRNVHLKRYIMGRKKPVEVIDQTSVNSADDVINGFQWALRTVYPQARKWVRLWRQG